MNTDNPFAPPLTSDEIASSEGPAVLIRASQNQRFLNLLVDIAVFYGCSFVAGILFSILLVMSNPGQSPAQFEAAIDTWSRPISIFTYFAYYIGMESLFSVTLGKLVTGTRVVRKDGRTASFGQIVGRSVARIIPFEAFSFLGSSAGGWHDSLSGTMVVKAR
jgi:uncharacterized RDD family membrane protein YckC